MRTDKLHYNLNSNTLPSFGLWFKYKNWPAIAVGIPMPRADNGLAETSGIKIGIKSQIAKGFVVDGNIFYIKGFNLKNVDNKILLRTMPNTYDLNVNLELYYIFNFKKFSYKSVYLFGETQKKSQGSFVLGLATGFVNLGTRKTIFAIGDSQNSELDFKNISTFSISIIGGYMHTFVFGAEKRWYINSAGYIGPNFHFGSTTFYRNKSKIDFANIGFNFKYKFSFGHNFDKLSLRLFSDGTFISYRPSNTSFLNNNIPSFKFGMIYKF